MSERQDLLRVSSMTKRLEMMMNPNQTPKKLASCLYPLVFRTDYSQPGFALLDLGPNFGSEPQRRLMVELKRQFDRLEFQHRGKRLAYQSMGRFDQQVTTKPHRDGGPDESILMLGYEPSLVRSRVATSDYSMCAANLGITPARFLDKFNPMFVAGQDKLAEYTTEINGFDNESFQILIINNSMNPIGEQRLVGVLHTAEIVNPNPDHLRVVNSTMIASVFELESERLSEREQAEFKRTAIVHKPDYS